MKELSGAVRHIKTFHTCFAVDHTGWVKTLSKPRLVENEYKWEFDHIKKDPSSVKPGFV